MYPRTWTGVTGIGSGAEWGTAKQNGYGGITYSKPQPITQEEGETDYVLEKAYYKARWIEWNGIKVGTKGGQWIA